MTETSSQPRTDKAPEWLFPNAASAADAPQAGIDAGPARDSGFGSGDLLQTSITLVALIGVILIAAWLVKRFGGIRQDPGQTLRLVASRSLGPRERIVVMDIDDRRLVLGVTAHNIRTLDTLGVPPESDTPAGTTSTPSFGQALAMQIRGKRAGFGPRRHD